MKRTRHYHVLVGLRGLYMPDSNDVHRPCIEAKQIAHAISVGLGEENY
jgi:hypothetical protein